MKKYPVMKKFNIPEQHSQGFFLAERKYDIHTGIDLYASEGTEVFSIFNGKVEAVVPFTGESVGSPWWNETQAVIVNSTYAVKSTYPVDEFFLNYGEIEPCVKKGMVVRAGDKIGTVKQVLKKDKGLPMSMLHLEAYTKSPIQSDGTVVFADMPNSVITSENIKRYASGNKYLFTKNYLASKFGAVNPFKLITFEYLTESLLPGDLACAYCSHEWHTMLYIKHKEFLSTKKNKKIFMPNEFRGLVFRQGEIVFSKEFL